MLDRRCGERLFVLNAFQPSRQIRISCLSCFIPNYRVRGPIMSCELRPTELRPRDSDCFDGDVFRVWPWFALFCTMLRMEPPRRRALNRDVGHTSGHARARRHRIPASGALLFSAQCRGLVAATASCSVCGPACVGVRSCIVGNNVPRSHPAFDCL